MNIFKSSNSTEVKVITSLSMLLFTLIIFILVSEINQNLNIYLRSFIVFFIVFTLIYFYANSLKEIVLTNNYLILKKRIGEKKIDISTIKTITEIPFSNLTSTVNSKGFFGFNGNLMDNNSISLINNRNNIIRISTNRTNYFLSVDKPENFIIELEKFKHIK